MIGARIYELIKMDYGEILELQGSDTRDESEAS